MRVRLHLLAVLPLALLALGAAPRPAAAHLLCELAVSDKATGQFGKQIQVQPGQVFFLRIAVLNVSTGPLVAVCDIPGLRVSVGRVLVPFSVKGVFLPKQVSSTTIAIVAKSAGTIKTSLLVRFLHPFTARVYEVSDSVLIVSGVTGDDKKGAGAKSGKDDKEKKGGVTPIGELGGAQQTGGTGAQQTGGTGAQQTGGTGAQQTGGAGGKDDKKDGALGAQQQPGGPFIF